MKKILMIILILILSMLSCEKSFDPYKSDVDCPCNSENNPVNLVFKYGISGKNVLNTFEGTYTKDMVVDPSITICLELTAGELDTIYSKMLQIDFFNYPDTFHVPLVSDTVAVVTPHSTYYFDVESGQRRKEIFWEDELLNADTDAEKLRELIHLIVNTIHSREAYKNLPEPRGGYC